MSIKHGIGVQEGATAISVPIIADSAIPVVIGCAPINLLENPAGAVNTPILANSPAEAMELLGYDDNFASFGLCGMMYVTNNVLCTSPVVYINVLDPARHVKTITENALAVTDGEAVYTANKGILLNTVVLKSGDETLAKDTDYTLGFDANGYLVITILSTSTYASAATLKLTASAIDPSAVTAIDIIGSVNATTGAETGMEVIRQVYPKLGIVPGLLLAPNYSENANVAIALAAKAQSINGCFGAMALVDLSTTAAPVYTAVKTAKEAAGLSSKYCEVLWPRAKVGSYILQYSTVMAALTEYTDANNNNIPYKSPSNELTGVTGMVLADGTEVYLDQDQANTVNSFGVVTAINLNGWRTWGNYTAAYPAVTDPKDIWISVRRMFIWQSNTFILSYFSKVDDPMNRRLIDTIIDTENIRCAALAPEYWAGAYIEYLEEDNPITEIVAGKITFRQHFAPYTPAQYILNIIDYDLGTLQAALQA
jgi:hypothetical protein